MMTQHHPHLLLEVSESIKQYIDVGYLVLRTRVCIHSQDTYVIIHWSNLNFCDQVSIIP